MLCLIFFIIIYIAWLLTQNVKKLILVVKGLETGHTLERWSFDCEIETQNENSG